MKSSPYPGAGPMHSALPASVTLLESIRQRLMRAGMADIPIHEWTAAQLVDCCVRNGVSMDDETITTEPVQ